MRIRHLLSLLLPAVVALSVAGCGASGGSASDYPDREVTLSVPLAAGGSTDTAAREVAEHLSRELGQPVVVENHPGAGGVVQTTEFARERPDGYTLQLSALNSLFLSNPASDADLGYSVDDFRFINQIGQNAVALSVSEKSPYQTLEDLVAGARGRGTPVTYGHTGVGSTLHLAGRRFFDLAGVDAQQVPFEGGGAALNALLAGDIDVYVSPVTTVLPYQGEGVRTLAVASAKPSQFLPEVPTMQSLGYDLDFSSIFVIYAPAEVPDRVVEVISGAFSRLAEDSEFQSGMNEIGIGVNVQDGQAVLDYLDRNRPVYEKMLDDGK